MANANQSANRAGNIFGRDAGAGFAGNDWENIVLKPGYIIKVRDRFHLVEAVEGLTVDLFFNDSFTFTISSSSITSASDGAILQQYGDKSMQAILNKTSDATHSNIRANMLKPSYDSGYIEFKDLEPYRGHIYHLCPSVPVQPKFVDLETGEFLVATGGTAGTLPSDGGTPLGLKAGSGNADHYHKAGTVSPKVYLRHPAGVPKWVLDEAPEGSSGSVKTASTKVCPDSLTASVLSRTRLDLLMWIESGENNLPSFKMVNDSEELILDARLTCGWKYRIVELGMTNSADSRP